MADAPEPTVLDDDNVPDVSLIDPPEVPAEDKPADTAKEEPKAAADDQGKPTEDKKPDAKDTEAKDTKPEDGKKPEGESDKKPDGQEEKPKDQPATPEDRKQQAQQAYQQRQRTRAQIANQLDQHYGPKTAEQLQEENDGMTPEQAQIEALRQEMAYKETRANISDLNANLRTDAVEVQKDFPIFDPNSPEYDKDFAEAVGNQYKVAARLQEENGIILNADLPLYDYYKQMADIYNRGTSRGTQQGQQQMQDMLARTENPGGSSSTNRPAAGSLEEMEERLGDVVIT